MGFAVFNGRRRTYSPFWVAALVAVIAPLAHAQPAGSYTVLHTFNSATDVIGPGGLIQATDGNFYGTSSGGPEPSAGTVFRMTPAGVVTILHSFPGGAGGANPAGIMQATDGNFYGVTGPNTNGGTVFKITPGGTLTTLHSFDGTDGFNPVGHLVEGTDGNLYGSTSYGANGCQVPDQGLTTGCGAVFRLTPAGGFTILHSFIGGSDGAKPSAFIQANDGNFYGTTKFGGGAGCTVGAGCGTVFRMTPAGVVTILYAFTDDVSARPVPSSLIQATDGNLYGTTGANFASEVFRITLAGTVTVLHTFPGPGSDPARRLIQANDGTFYGTTARGAANGTSYLATIYRITAAGDVTVVHTFEPDWTVGASLLQGANGNLYGTARNAIHGTTVAFEITLGGAPAIIAEPQSQTITSGQTATLIVGAVGSGLSFQWYVSTGGTGGYALIDGATSGSYTTPPLTATTLYYVRISNASGTADAEPATILVATPLAIKTQPVSQMVTEGQRVVFFVSATGTPIPTFHWQVAMNAGASWTDLNNTSNYISASDLYVTSTRELNGAQYRCLVTNGTGPTLVSNVATLTVRPFGDIPVPGDYDGDGKTDIAVYRPPTANWFVLRSSNNFTTWDTYQWGTTTPIGDIPVAADYDGDGRTDIAIYRPSNGTWYILTSKSGFTAGEGYAWGVNGDVPVAADYDGDGRADITVYRPATGHWFVLRSSSNDTIWSTHQWGALGDVPMPADYDGDGRTDVAIYRRSTAVWWVSWSSSNYTTWGTFQWGTTTPLGDIPVAADYDGDRKADLAIYRPSIGRWYILKSSSGFTVGEGYAWGANGDIPVVLDTDGDGRADIAVHRASTSHWFVRRSSTNYFEQRTYEW